MCIRALDYCPPIDLTFGDYLRGIITADADAIRDDERDYRLAFIDAFRRRGIYPEGIKTLSVESLRHAVLNIGYDKEGKRKHITSESHDGSDEGGWEADTEQLLRVINDFLRDYGDDIKYVNDRKDIYDVTRAYIGGGTYNGKNIVGLHGRLNVKFANSIDFSRITGLAFLDGYNTLGIPSSRKYNGPSYQITKMRLVSRVGPNGAQINQVVICLVQKCGAKFKNGVYSPYTPARDPFSKKDNDGKTIPDDSFEFRGGCTLIFDLDTQLLKYAINRPIVDMDTLQSNKPPEINRQRLDSQHKFLQGDGDSSRNEFTAYFGSGCHQLAEPFAFLHQI
jgi:hypothetical protein